MFFGIKGGHLWVALLCLVALSACLNFNESALPCGGERYCPAPASCIAGRCVARCYRDEECGEGGQCVFNRCVAPETPPDQSSEDAGLGDQSIDQR
ncbi:MAG: hypothetical protein VYD19_06390 [Myxococcota bacterium]|nr:hypothetical protein [Myxococcota bacterium]